VFDEDLDIYNLKRFVEAQDKHCNGYLQALQEIKNSKKIGHWMWYIFPQLKGLGQSELSYLYGLSGIDEAIAYLNHNILGIRLIETSTSFYNLTNINPLMILGMPDCYKLKSCMTLFYIANNDNLIFKEVLDKFYKGLYCKKTIEILEIKDPKYYF
jgi:uncharacterized protein (DUF1810 family)